MITLPITITPKRIADLMTTALEGGITYWCSAVKPAGATLRLAEARPGGGYPWYADPALYEGDFCIDVSEMLEGEHPDANTVHRVTREEMTKGFALMAKEHGAQFGAFLAEDEDAGTADVWLQLVALGELRYG